MTTLFERWVLEFLLGVLEFVCSACPEKRNRLIAWDWGCWQAVLEFVPVKVTSTMPLLYLALKMSLVPTG